MYQKHADGIACSLTFTCEVLEKTWLRVCFDGVIGPKAKRIAAVLAVGNCGEVITTVVENQVDLIMLE